MASEFFHVTKQLSEICQRLRVVRERHYGNRGRSKLCRDLGITPSSYSLYEVDRVPPVDLLLLVVQHTGVRLEWLLTGAGPEFSNGPAYNVTDDSHTRSASRVSDWIPVIGCTAAGPARYWEELPETHGGPEADARLESVLAEYVDQIPPDPPRMGDLSPPSAEARTVSLVQFSTPDERGFLEFLNAPTVKRRYPRALAWRIDGESMAPRYLDGDLVITSTDQAATDGHPCVSRQRGQIGVNCKLYQKRGNDVLLIPINEQSPTQCVPADQIQWAYRVLCSVRLG